MPARSKVDIYSNRAFISVTCSAANTLTFEQIRFAVGTFQGIGLLLHKVHYYPTLASMRELVAATDSIALGVTLRDDLTDLDPTNQAVLSHKTICVTGANPSEIFSPLEEDFTHLPGGGLLVPANPIYAAINTAGAAAASVVRLQLFYTFVQLTDRESIELLQTIIPGNV